TYCSNERKRRSTSGSTLVPDSRMLSVAHFRSSAIVHVDEATPTTGTVSASRFTIAYSAGKIILCARSPVTPNSTRASDTGGCALRRLTVRHPALRRPARRPPRPALLRGPAPAGPPP